MATTGLSLEERRAATMARNAALLDQLGIASAASKLERSLAGPPPTKRARRDQTPRASRRGSSAAAQRAVAGPVRRSARARGLAPEGGGGGESASGAATTDDDPDAIGKAEALPAKEYFGDDVQKKAIIVDGHFRGWVDPRVCKAHGIAGDADTAWGSGPSWSRKNPTGARTPAAAGAAGKLSAKESAQRMFKKNPNAYFYRHCEPGQTQAMDEGVMEMYCFLFVVCVCCFCSELHHC
jgi:hypothetical protein